MYIKERDLKVLQEKYPPKDRHKYWYTIHHVFCITPEDVTYCTKNLIGLIKLPNSENHYIGGEISKTTHYDGYYYDIYSDTWFLGKDTWDGIIYVEKNELKNSYKTYNEAYEALLVEIENLIK